MRAHHGPALQRGHPAGHLSALPPLSQTVVQAVPKASSGVGASGYACSVSLGGRQPEAGLGLGLLGRRAPQDSPIRLRAAHARPGARDWGWGRLGLLLSGLWEWVSGSGPPWAPPGLGLVPAPRLSLRVGGSTAGSTAHRCRQPPPSLWPVGPPVLASWLVAGWML